MENLEQLHSLPSICRLCLSVGKAQVLRNILLSPVPSCHKTLGEMIYECTSVQVQESDGLPQNICYECCEEVYKMHHFRSQCLSSDALLRSQLHIHSDLNDKVTNEATKSSLSNAATDYFNNYSDEESTSTNCTPVQHASFSTSQKLTQITDRPNKVKHSGKVMENQTDSNTLALNQNLEVKSARSSLSHVKRKASLSSGSKVSWQSRILGENPRRIFKKARFVCPECNKVFKHRYSLTRHCLLHKGNSFVCKHCKKCFGSLQSVKRHEKNHLGVKPFQCNLCEKSYVSSSSFAAHVRKHTGERPYQCSECSEAFYLLTSFDRHVAKHRGVKKYVCEICSASFWVEDDLRAHVNRVH